LLSRDRLREQSAAEKVFAIASFFAQLALTRPVGYWFNPRSCGRRDASDASETLVARVSRNEPKAEHLPAGLGMRLANEPLTVGGMRKIF